jgi:DNA-binding transcriptional LysR family regulator
MRDLNYAGLRRLDLNLLLVFDAVLSERSVTRAGERLLLTQGAISHALNRLRSAIGDELFVRSKDGMKPTRRALELAEPLQEALSRLSATLGPPEFDPATSTRTFRLASTDYFATLVLPRLIARIEAEAPRVDLRILPHTVANVSELLDAREVEFAIGFFQNSLRDMRPGNTSWIELCNDRVVCVMRRDHPLARTPLTLECYLGASHLLYSLTGEPSSMADAHLKNKNLARRVGLTICHYLAAPLVLESSDMIMTVPARMAALYVEKYGLTTTPSPLELPATPTQLVWNTRFDARGEHRWLRELIVDVSKEMQAPAGKSGAPQRPRANARKRV